MRGGASHPVRGRARCGALVVPANTDREDAAVNRRTVGRTLAAAGLALAALTGCDNPEQEVEETVDEVQQGVEDAERNVEEGAEDVRQGVEEGVEDVQDDDEG